MSSDGEGTKWQQVIQDLQTISMPSTEIVNEWSGVGTLECWAYRLWWLLQLLVLFSVLSISHASLLFGHQDVRMWRSGILSVGHICAFHAQKALHSLHRVGQSVKQSHLGKSQQSRGELWQARSLLGVDGLSLLPPDPNNGAETSY